MRKEEGSFRLEKEIPRIARVLFGIREDISRLKAPELPLQEEDHILNEQLITLLDRNLQTKHNGQCKYFGETLLGAYLNAFVTFTTLDADLDFGKNPPFLAYPLTGGTLELDILLEDFYLAFEFQGEHHYTDAAVQAKDAFKLATCATAGKLLIPVNPYQLSSGSISNLIANSLVDFLGVRDVICNNYGRQSVPNINRRLKISFCKAIQRIYLGKTMFAESLAWLDLRSASYISGQAIHSPISASTSAPRLHMTGKPDISIEEIYRNLRYISR